MANLQDIAGDIYNEGFNPETDAVSDFEEIPDGSYEALLTDFKHRVSDNTGTEWFSMEFEITDEKQTGRKYFGNLFLTEKTAKRSIKQLMKYAHLLGLQLELTDFADEATIVEKMQDVLGNQVVITLKSSTNKKTDKTFQNFSMDLNYPFE